MKMGDYRDTQHEKKLIQTMQTKTVRAWLTGLMKEITNRRYKSLGGRYKILINLTSTCTLYRKIWIDI